MASTGRRVGAAGLVLGLGLGAVSMIPAHADTAAAPAAAPAAAAPAVSGLLGAVDGGLLGGVLGSLLHGQGGIFGPDGGVIAGDDQLGDVLGGLASDGGGELVGAVGDVVSQPQIGGQGSFGEPQSPVGGLLGGLLSNGVGLLGGVL